MEEDVIKQEIAEVVKPEQYLVLVLHDGLTAQGRYVKSREHSVVLESIEGHWRKNEKSPTFLPDLSINKSYVPFSDIVYFMVGE